MKNIFMMFGVFLMLSLVCAANGAGVHDAGTGMDSSSPGAEVQVDGQGAGEPALISNAGEGQRVQLQAGSHLGTDGQQMMIQQESANQLRLEVGGNSAKTSMKMNQEMVNGQTKLSTQLSNGRNAEVKVMPDKASETALERLRLKNCVESEGCSIELKEVGAGEKAQLAYEVKTQRRSKVFGLFGAEMNVEAQVDAETGEVVRVNKPWWAFLATEPAE